MNSSMRLALALAAAGLAAPAAANDGAPPVLANTELDVLTASTVLAAGGLAGGAPAGTVLAADATGFVENATPRFSAWLWTPTRLAEGGLGGNALAAGSLLPAGSPATAAGAGETASAAASVTGASVSRSVGTRSPDTTAAASASAAGPGLSSVSVTAHSAPGFSGAFSRSTSLSAR